MATSITNAFITQFEAEVHMAYQRMGSKLKNLVRQVNGVNGNTVKFQKVAKGSANTKARHAEVVAMDLSHSTVSATLTDYYAADYVDKLDELKVNIDERQVVAQSAAYALGRKTDDIIVDIADSATKLANNSSGTGTGMNLGKAQAMMELFNTNDVPDDNQRYWVIGPKQWSDLLSLDQFSRTEYVGEGELPYAGGMTAKRWLGFLWFVHSGLNIASSDRETIAFHKSSIGLGVGSDVKTEVNYIPEKVSHLITSMLSMGGTLIDTNGIRIQKCAE
jgi:DNA-binding transcriptional ArsR family regulator